MKLKLFVLVAFVSIFNSIALAQITGYNATIKSGLTYNSVDLFVTPTGTGSSTVQFSQFNIVVGVPQTCKGGAPIPTATPSLSSFITTNFGAYAAPVFNQNGVLTSIGGINFYVWDINYNQASSNTASLTAGTEYKLATVTFTGSTPSCNISLLDHLTNTTTNTYIFDATIGGGTFYSPQIGNMTFYPGVAGGGNGASTVPVNNGTGVVATTSNLVSLPVTISGYDVKCNDKGALLTWSTSSEQNSDRFEIQKSTNNTDWVVIDNVSASGNSAVQRNYQYQDLNGGSALYRIRLVDRDGQYVYSAIKQTNCKASQFDISLYPVPARDKITVVIRSDKSVKTVLQMIDMSGRIVNRTETQVNSGNNNIELNVSKLPAGQYMLTSSDPSIVINKKFTVAR